MAVDMVESRDHGLSKTVEHFEIDASGEKRPPISLGRKISKNRN